MAIEPTDYEFAQAEMLEYPEIPLFEKVVNSNTGFSVVERNDKIVDIYILGSLIDSLIFNSRDEAHQHITGKCDGLSDQNVSFERIFGESS